MSIFFSYISVNNAISRLIICLLCLLVSFDTLAQQVNVYGTVIDRDKREPLSDASVIISMIDANKLLSTELTQGFSKKLEEYEKQNV